MRCEICGKRSGSQPLCRKCRAKAEHEEFLYQLKDTLVTENEFSYLECIETLLPEEYQILPQANLASFIEKTNGARFQGELFRNVDFLIATLDYEPVFIIEINDQTHNLPERRARDIKVNQICEEAGIPIITLWTSYGVNPEYIERRILETLDRLPVERIHHFDPHPENSRQKRGCYVATCVYGSYDCPEVRTLRRFRDFILARSPGGRLFIRVYYAVSPTLVKYLGTTRPFQIFFRFWLNRLIGRLQSDGISSEPYEDA